MFNSVMISAFLVLLCVMGCGKDRATAQSSVDIAKTSQSEAQMTGVVLSYTENGWRDRNHR